MRSMLSTRQPAKRAALIDESWGKSFRGCFAVWPWLVPRCRFKSIINEETKTVNTKLTVYLLSGNLFASGAKVFDLSLGEVQPFFCDLPFVARYRKHMPQAVALKP